MDKTTETKIKKMGFSPFKIKTEKPNYYELADKTILKVYPIVNSLEMDKGPNPQGAISNTQNIVAAFVPKKLRGEPDSKSYSTSELNSHIDKEDMQFKTIAEHFNEYIVDGKWILSIKTMLTQVNRSKLRNSRGDPIYWVNTSPALKLKPKRR